MWKLDEFGSFLGMPFDGFEDEAMELFCRIEGFRKKCGGVGDGGM